MVQLFQILLTLGWFWFLLEHYGRRRPFWDELRELLRVLGTMFLIAGAMAFLVTQDTSREELIWQWAAYFILIPVTRAVVRTMLDHVGYWKRTRRSAASATSDTG